MANEAISSAPDAGPFNPLWRVPIAVPGNTSPASTSAGMFQGPSISGTGITGNALLGTLPANTWPLRLLLRDKNRIGGASVGLGTILGAADILPLQTVPASGTYSLTVDIPSFFEGSFADGTPQPVYITSSGGGTSISAQLDYEPGP
jgi:hypothetical protein